MAITKTMEQAYNDQLREELASAYLYLSMSAYFERKDLPGFAHWMHIQFQEEMAHHIRFFNYMVARAGEIRLQAIAAPTYEWANPLEVFKATLAHEQHITERINFLMGLAHQEKDFASTQFLQWFVNEQVEEEANVSKIIGQLKLVGEAGLYLLDKELGQRVFVDPNAQGTQA